MTVEKPHTWRELISMALQTRKESWADVSHTTLSDDDLDLRFDSGYGSSKGKPFTLWTAKRVYFPATYDGAEWVESVPRHPCGEETTHVGGGDG